MLERMHQRIQSLLFEVGFLHQNNPDRIYDELRAIIARAEPGRRAVVIGSSFIGLEVAASLRARYATEQAESRSRS